MEYSYHVTFGKFKKIIKCLSKDAVIEEVKNIFGIVKSIELQVYNDEFLEWVDIDNPNELPDKGKLLATLTGIVICCLKMKHSVMYV